MECRFCQALNADDDHRCSRCGRRLRMTSVYTASSAAVPALRYESGAPSPIRESSGRAGVAVEAPPPPPPPPLRKPITYQPSLFNSRELPRVVPFETIAPGSVEAPPRKPVSTKPRPRHRKIIPGQQSLEFAPTAGSARYVRPSEGVIYCDAPVAVPAHRAMAAALDGSMLVMALAVFGLIFNLAGGEVVMNSRNIWLVIGVTTGVAILYRLLWCLADGDTPGMRWTHLKLVDFDGQKPDRGKRLLRLAAGVLSLFAAGLGVLWALVDEETLTWHDHISKTFPTPY